MSHLHSGPHKLHFSSTQAPSQTQVLFQWNPGHKILVSTPSINRLSSIKFASQIHPGPHIHISPPYRYPYQGPNYSHVVSHLDPGPDICVSLPSRWRLTNVVLRKLIGNMVEKIFFRKKYFFSARNIFFRKKYFFPQEIFFSARNIFFSARNIFLRKKYIFLRKKYIFSARNKLISARN